MEKERLILEEAVRRAGVRTLEMARDGFEIHIKKDHSPVTSADLEVNRILYEAIHGNFPEDGWLSEETPDSPSRLNKKRVWIIDPIDGTKSFIKRLPSFCISAALIESEAPVAAVIFNPSTEELFSAVRGSGLRVNGQPVKPERAASDRPVVLANRWEVEQSRFMPWGESVEYQPMNSIAYALALVAVDRMDAAITFEQENEWDVAAGVLLIEEAGGIVTDGVGRPWRFNRPQPRMKGTIALSPAAKDRFQPMVKELLKP
ncbi:MAG: 3'(2'),5'-bisphosphate nucleotidase CysQ [Nitrospiraceae bacterium]